MKIVWGLIFAWLFMSCSSTFQKPAPHPPPKKVAPPKDESPLVSQGDSLSTAMPFPDAADSAENVGWDLAPKDSNASHTSVQNPIASDVKMASTSDTLQFKTQPRPKNLAEKIHVLLSRGQHSLSLYSLGEVQILSESENHDPKNPEKKITVTKVTSLRGAFVIKRNGNNFEITQGRTVIASSNAKRLRVVGINPYNLLDIKGSVYRGGLHVITESDGNMMAVNVLDLEDYLRGVLPYELGTVDRQGLEALKALAVVARTYAVKRMLRTGNPDFHVYNDVQDQVYKGVKGEYLLSDRAVQETRGMVLMHQDTLAQCYYFSTCGGYTASKHEVWGGDSISYLTAMADTDDAGDAYCKASRYSSWTETWTIPELTKILKRNLKSAGVSDFKSFNSLKNIEVTSRARCGRVRILTITTESGAINIKGDKVRWALRPNANQDKILSSAMFEVNVNNGRITVSGHGFGHGVGLCQVGAIGRAHEHQTFKEIIAAYYHGTEVVGLK